MSLLVNDISYVQAIRTIRELVLDTNPVPCFNVSGQDLSFIKSASGFLLAGVSYPFADVPKFYDLLRILRAKQVAIEILPDYVASEATKYTEDFNYPSISDKKQVMREHYFSTDVMEELMISFFENYLPYDGVSRTTEAIFNNMWYMEKRRFVYWMAYYLIDRKRMNYASVAEMIRLQNEANGTGGGCSEDGELKNTEMTITTRIGEVFTATERIAESGNGMAGFTSLWGDKYSYLTKLQLWIRDRFEKQFKDFSLRDDCMISQTFTMEKKWQDSAWVDTINFNRDTIDFLQPDR